MSIFCHIHNLEHLIEEPTCFKNPEKPTTIDLILTNKPKCPQHSCAFEICISDFHKMTLAVLKVLCKKQSPKIITNVIYKNFSSSVFREHLKLNLEKHNTCQFILKYSRFFFLTQASYVSQKTICKSQPSFIYEYGTSYRYHGYITAEE